MRLVLVVYASPGSAITLVLTGAPAGLVGTLALRIVDPPSTVVRAETTAGVAEGPAGVYSADIAAPATAGTYLVVWRNGATETLEELQVVGVLPGAVAGAVGAAYFSVAEARAVRPLQDSTRYSDAAIGAARQTAEQSLEDACGVPFVPRSFTITGTLAGPSSTLLLPIRTLTIVSASADGVAVPAALVELVDSGEAYLPGGWPAGRIAVSGVHGYAAPPLRVKRAALLLTKRVLVDSPVNDRATQQTNPDGSHEFFITAGRNGQPFDIPELNAVVQIYGVRHGSMVA